MKCRISEMNERKVKIRASGNDCSMLPLQDALVIDLSSLLLKKEKKRLVR